jgi:hypothetical protein
MTATTAPVTRIAANGDVFLTSATSWNGVPTGNTYTRKIGNVCKDITRSPDRRWEAAPGKRRTPGRMGKHNCATQRDAVAWLVAKAIG